MGPRPLELTLQRRLLVVLAPALAAVGAATVGILWVALDRADDTAALSRAEAAAHSMASELAEGESPPAALEEVAHAIETSSTQVWLRAGDRLLGHPDSDLDVGALTPGRCATLRDRNGTRWRACAAGDAALGAVAAISTTAHVDAVRTVATGAAAAVLLALVLAIIATRAALRGPLASLDDLVRWVEDLVRAERSVSVPRTMGSAEIDRLAHAFNELVERLFATLERERSSAAHIAHELRTPLTAMRVELETLADREPIARRLIDDVERLSRAIDAILVLSQPAAAPAESCTTLLNVADVVRELTPAGTAIVAPDEALIRGDEQLIALALRNVLENATKYAGGPSRVSVVRDDGKLTVEVHDRGQGLDAEGCVQMFEPHWRGSRAQAGSGLGLALVRAVAARHGGDATARPNPEGPGLAIALRLGPLVAWHD